MILRVGAAGLEVHDEACNLKISERVHFRHRLEGANDWQDGGTRRTAHESRPGPGRDAVHVAVSVGQGAWSTMPASLSFVLPPAWQVDRWFRLLRGLAALTVL